MKNRQSPSPEEEDKELWLELTEEVKEIKKPSKNAFSPSKNIKISPKDSSYISAPSTKSSNSDMFDNYADIDANTLKKFRKNGFPVEATLDLHGYKESDAYDAVIRFIKSSYSRKMRCVIIVTGKGINPHNDDDIFSPRGILKNAVPKWLNSDELKPFILSFIHPSASLGGSGALYILLRRNK
jgi:DNA-nicking Smr family endonuclease